MKKIKISFLALFVVLCQSLFAASSVNLTPVPKSMAIGEGELVLPQSFTILVDGPDSIVAEAEHFAVHMNEVSKKLFDVLYERVLEDFETLKKFGLSSDEGKEIINRWTD